MNTIVHQLVTTLTYWTISSPYVKLTTSPSNNWIQLLKNPEYTIQASAVNNAISRIKLTTPIPKLSSTTTHLIFVKTASNLDRATKK